jgi:S-adenosylmethionine synthetase
MQTVVSAMELSENTVEVVERKGLGHPDTICDALAETLSRNLCRAYLQRYGQILHHNVDKALLCGGRARPAFRGGSVLFPIRIYLAGRVTTTIGNEELGIKEIVIEGSRSWLTQNLHALDANHHVQLYELVQPGSQDLQELFSQRGRDSSPLANDTSIGVGYAPLTHLERLVLSVEQQINTRERNRDHAAWGEDVKIMGVRYGSTVRLTVACAMIGRHIAHIDDYLNEKVAIKQLAQQLAEQHGFPECDAVVNAADGADPRSIYLTVTGTSAEAGDDGQVGRGNRVNGLITPCRSMSLEAAAGKNPVTHVGKIYNVLAREICEALLAGIAEVAEAHCLLVSQIGSPIKSPALVQIKIATREQFPIDSLRGQVEEITTDQLAKAPQLIDDFVAGAVSVF